MIRRIDFILILSFLSLITIGLLFIYSSSVDISGQLHSNEFARQLFFVIVGIVVFIALQFIPFKYISEYSVLAYGLCIILLLCTLLFGEIRNGAKSWLGIFGFGIQASEFMKIGAILYFAFLLDTKTPNLDKLISNFKYTLIMIFPVILILLQPDMGTALVFIPIVLGMMYVYGVKYYKILFVVGIGIIANITLIISYYLNTIDLNSSKIIELLSSRNYFYYLIILAIIYLLAILGKKTGYWKSMFTFISYIISVFLTGGILAYLAKMVLKPYQIQRLLVFVNPESDPLGSGWHILQSKAAIGAGGITGQGFLQGTQSKLEFLPQKSTDFIFSVIGEEIGLIGSALVLVLYMILLWRIILIGMNSNDVFSKLYCSGVGAMIFIHFMVNVGMTLGIMPITGIPLLFVSYGGSSLLSSIVAVAIVHNIYFKSTYKSQISTIQ